MTVEELQAELQKAEKTIKQVIQGLSERSGLPSDCFSVVLRSHYGIGGGSVGFQVEITAEIK